ncbi:hypothetical protein BDP27DRAFT_1370016 [Rhodocollybia butyracea]|uniref:Uncharacterized protein n=1 Tax=Rhodocollybia butyracea TaxID=206335 RepID=A0A9P5PCX1_9AGAR|nr:hypothetical protein BDP27DRAFT_1370016 [Rhodocollybia butyracea]
MCLGVAFLLLLSFLHLEALGMPASGLRSGKEFRGPISYDLALALEELLSDKEGNYDMDLEEDETYLDSTSCSSALSSWCPSNPQLSTTIAIFCRRLHATIVLRQKRPHAAALLCQ